MAEETKQLLLSLEFDTDEALKRAANFRSAIDADKEALAELNKVIKAGGELNGEQLLQREKLEQRIKETTQARSAELKAVNDHIKATKSAIDADGKYNGSINNLRGSLAFLTAKWNDLSKSERENAEVGGVLQQEIKRLSDELKGLEGSVGDTRRNVGNYAGGLREAVEQSGFLSGVTMKVQDAQQKLNATFTIMKAGLGGNISMLKLFRLALLSTGIGAIVLLLGGLVSYLTKTQEGIDFVAAKTKGLTTVMGVLTDKLSGVGEAVFKAFSNPKQALIDLVSFIQTNLLNRVKAIGVIFDALAKRDFNKLQDGVAQLALGVTDATAKLTAFTKELGDVAKAGEEIERINQRIRDSERALNVERARSKTEIERLKFAAEDVARSDAERIAAAQKAFNMEQGIVNRQLQLQRERIANIIKEQSLTNNLTADNEKLAEEQTKLAEMEEGSLTRQIELRNKINEINTAARAKAEALFKEDKKRLEEQLKLFQEVAEKTQEINERHLGFERDRKAERDKFLEDDTKRLDEQVKDQLARSEANVAIAEREAQDKIALKEREYQVLVGFTDAASQLAAALANESSALADFQKAVTLFQIGLASAEAITKGIAASQDIPFPGNLVAMGTTIATIATNLLQAKQLIDPSPAPKPPASRFASGGILEGPSHAEGGITGTGRFANVEVEGGEAVINKRATALFAPILSAINMAGGGKPLAPTNYAAMGGYIGSSAAMGAGNTLIDYDKLANKMAAAVAKMPAPVVGISDIKAASARQDERHRRVTLG